MQISDTQTYKNLSIKDIVLYNIRRCIFNGSSKYLHSDLLNENDYPLDIKMESAFFGKQQDLERAQSSIGGSLSVASTTWYILPQDLMYGYIREIITRLSHFAIDKRSIREVTVSITATRLKLAEFGVYIDPFSLEFGLKRFLAADGGD